MTTNDQPTRNAVHSGIQHRRTGVEGRALRPSAHPVALHEVLHARANLHDDSEAVAAPNEGRLRLLLHLRGQRASTANGAGGTG